MRTPLTSSLASPLAVLLLALLAFSGITTAPGATALEPDKLERLWQEADLDWDGGDYIAALEGFIEILDAPGGDRFLEPIALLTGELYRVEEIAPDGRGIRISPDGRYAAFQVTREGKTFTQVVELEGDFWTVAELEGGGFIFSPAGSFGAYLAIEEGDELTEARAAAEEVRDDRMAYRQQRRTVQWLEAKNARIVVVDLESGKAQELQDGGLIKGAMRFSPDGETLYMVGAPEDGLDQSDIYAFDLGTAGASNQGPVALTAGGGFRTAARYPNHQERGRAARLDLVGSRAPPLLEERSSCSISGAAKCAHFPAAMPRSQLVAMPWRSQRRPRKA